MKDLGKRLDRIENLICQEDTIPMVALRDELGIHWNGVIYPDERSLSRASDEILGVHRDRPLIIITQHSKGLENEKTA